MDVQMAHDNHLEPLLSTEGKRLLLLLEGPRHSIKVNILFVDVHTFHNLIKELGPFHRLCEYEGALDAWFFQDEFVASVSFSPYHLRWLLNGDKH